MRITLDIEEADIEKIVKSLDNQYAYTRARNFDDSGISGWPMCFVDS